MDSHFYISTLTRLRLGIVIAWMALFTPLFAAEPEYNVKAAYLLNFTRLVQWPTWAFSSPQSPMIIGVVGRDPFSGGLGTALRGQKAAGGREIEVRSVSASDAESLQRCHAIFISSSQRITDVARAVQGRPVLLVGDAEDFAREGGIIGFVTRDQKIKLQINNAAARQMQLKIPSALLGLATIVN